MIPLFDLSLQLNGFPIKKAKSELLKIQSIPEQEFENFFKNKKQEIVEYHLKNNPFYQKYIFQKLERLTHNAQKRLSETFKR